MVALSTAEFSINGSLFATGGFDALNGQVLTLDLEASPGHDVRSIVWSVPRASPGAPALVFSPSASPSNPLDAVTVTMPASGEFTWDVRAQVNGGIGADNKPFAPYTKERAVAIRTSVGLRKIFAGETLQYDPQHGWVSALDELLVSVTSIVAHGVRNETGSTLLKGRAISVVGQVGIRYLVQLADNTDPAKRPAIGVLPADLPNNTNGIALAEGRIVGVDTSAFALTDQLVLGTLGQFIRPYPETDPFIGELQHVGSVARVHATLGEIVIGIGGLDQVFGLNFREATSIAADTTSSTTFQTKVTIATPAATGTYFLAWSAICSRSAGAPNAGEVRLQNQTDAVTLGQVQSFNSGLGELVPRSKLATIVLGSGSKTIAIEWRSTSGSTTQQIEDAQIMLWRIK